MDEQLRDLERRAATGDERARTALEQEWHRLGRGWTGESLPRGLRRAEGRGLYTWTDRGFALVLVRVPSTPGFWIARRPVSCAEYDAYKSPINGRDRDRPPSPFGQEDADPRGVRWGSAVGFCERVGLRVPSIAEWQEAAENSRDLMTVPDLWEWCLDEMAPGQRVIFNAHARRRSWALADERVATIGCRPVLVERREA